MRALLVGLVVVQCAAILLLWWRTRATRVEARQLRTELSDSQARVQSRLDDAARMRTDRIATVSHEFRTPLTGIRGAAVTLRSRGERLTPQARAQLLGAVLDQQERLSRLLENMLTASRATDVDPTAVTDVEQVAADVAVEAQGAHPQRPPVTVVVEPGTAARITRPALQQILANLVDNAQQHGTDDGAPLLAAGFDAAGVWMTVSNQGRTLDLDAAARLFEPFTQAQSGATRGTEGMGMGLFVVRRLVEVYGGSVDVRSESDWVTVEVRLQRGVEQRRSAELVRA